MPPQVYEPDGLSREQVQQARQAADDACMGTCLAAPADSWPQPTYLPIHCTRHPTLPTLWHATCPLAHLPTCPPAHLPTLQIMSIKASHSGRLTDYKSDTCTYMEGWARAWHSLVVAVGGGGRLVQG